MELLTCDESVSHHAELLLRVEDLQLGLCVHGKGRTVVGRIGLGLALPYTISRLLFSKGPVYDGMRESRGNLPRDEVHQEGSRTKCQKYITLAVGQTMTSPIIASR